MKAFRLYLTLIIITLLPTVLPAQKSQSDSLDYYLKSKLPFDQKFSNLYRLTFKLTDEEPDKCMRIMRTMYVQASERNDTARMAKANFIVGYCYGVKENYVIALEYYFKALPYEEEQHDTTTLLLIYNGMGIAFSKQMQYKKAIEYFLKVVKIAEVSNNDYSKGVSYNNVAIEYKNVKQYSLSDKYLKKSLDIFKETHKGYISFIDMNRGVIRFERGQYDSAMYYYYQAKYYHQHYIDKVLPAGISNNIGEIHYHQGNYDSALFYLNYTLTQIDTINDKYSLRETYGLLSKVYHAMNNNNKAYYYLKKNNYLTQFIYDSENLKRVLSTEADFKVIKKENEMKISEERHRAEKAHDDKMARLFYIFSFIIGALLITALVIAVLRFREKKKANEILTEQKNRIQEQQNEITDSINYARNIQHSILPAEDYLEKTLRDYLLFYQPRDIVGGDFYFVEQIDNRIYFAVVDCTGHGVPGGFMSILGFNGLQKCLHDFQLRKPSEILDALSKVVVQHFTHQGKQALRDGMDMALCCLYHDNGNIQLEYAGANNPCWIVQATNGQLLELNPNKQPIGYFENQKPFENISITLQKGDVVYLFSDGYADQFGGPSGKKFKYAQLKSLLQLQSGSIDMKAREALLKKSFEDWRAHYEQIDDVCLLGVKVS